MDNVQKFVRAVHNLRPNTEMVFSEEITTEEQFNQVKWKTGEDENGNMISTNVCPHSEITWALVKAEMDSL